MHSLRSEEVFQLEEGDDLLERKDEFDITNHHAGIIMISVQSAFLCKIICIISELASPIAARVNAGGTDNMAGCTEASQICRFAIFLTRSCSSTTYSFLPTKEHLIAQVPDQ